MYEINMNVTAKGMIHWLSLSRGPIKKHVARCPERCAVRAYERMMKYLSFTVNNIVFYIIPREDDLGLHRRMGKTAREGQRVAIGVARPRSVAAITVPLRNSMFDGGKINIRNMTWMRTMDNRLIPSIPVEDMGRQASKTIHRC
jgi:hypothetical protein